MLLWILLPGAMFMAAVLHLRLSYPRPSIPAVPIPMMPKTNAFDFYVAASHQMHGETQLLHTDRLSLSQEALLVQENATALKTLRRGLSLPYQPPPARSINDTFPFYHQQRELAQLLTAEARVRAAKGDWRGAAQSDLDSIQMGTQVVHGSPLVGCLVGLACQAIGRRPLWAAVDHLNADEAQAASRRLQAIQANQTPFAETMQEERWFGQAAMQEQLKLPAFQNYPRFIRAIPLSNFTQYMDQSLANARQPYAAHPAEPVMPRDPFSVLFLPIFNGVYLHETDNRTQNAFLTAALALRAYRLEQGAYPATLTSLTPGYLQSIPTDPFALSGMVHYKRLGKKYLLYSVGPDGKDNGGEAIFDQTKPVPNPGTVSDPRRYVKGTSQGDIVAGVNH